jgi:hypothetical protein
MNSDRKSSWWGKALTILGALIVFVTFIVKDGIADHLKEVTDALHSAENTFVVRSSENELAERVNAIDETVAELYAMQKAGDDQSMLHVTNLVITKHTMDRSHRNESEELDSLSTVIEILPQGPQRNSQEKQFADDIAQQGAELAQLDAAPVTDESWIKLNAFDLEFRLFKEQVNLTKFADLILAQARQARKFEEKRLRVATYASYGLYMLGWGLALSGRLFGSEELVPAE